MYVLCLNVLLVDNKLKTFWILTLQKRLKYIILYRVASDRQKRPLYVHRKLL